MQDADGERRRVVRTGSAPFLPYDLEGPVQPDMSWLPISYDRVAQRGSYLMRMEPGAATLPHEHPGFEDFLILDGDLVDSDGSVFCAGDFVSYRPGTRHSSRTRGGCLIAVCEWRP
jgi:anti-sigma factor ChrR (cupin superfamily)